MVRHGTLPAVMWRLLLQRYRQPIVLTLALALPLLSMYWHGKKRDTTTVVERGLMAVTAPGQGVAHGALEALRGLFRHYLLLTDVAQRNESLERENRQLLGEALRARALNEELHRVKQLCEFKTTRRELVTVPAQVVGRDLSQYFQVTRLQIDLQGLPQVKEGQAVITHDGVVGRIEHVSGAFADVLLATDARSQLHATIPGRGVVGTVKGNGKSNELVVQFLYLEQGVREAPVRAQDAVITTGHDHVFPAGLEIGHVAEPSGKLKGAYQEFTIVPAVSYAALEEVLIVVGQAPAAAGPASGAPDAPAVDAGKPARRVVDPANTPDAPP
jgi:rod shape-determining protein MreC